ncbi:ATP-dependent zinc metalloprotease FtsH [Pirellula sp. SH-Sr6A]|uniref:ATP-dependent zinc metalloprotease FtsH n=1 Tax=Pirellula sp. SH-Sr6A TaxID=1632865 RepID=UPI00078CA5B0|nr:ATP-dependent zinc metalloprotease FtsH [Pirellula sp. SH-Sr6A]AMV32834.1 ATP-dependent zinc metalloprotease FtsH [Pirellula sp. SH-Sr6A]
MTNKPSEERPTPSPSPAQPRRGQGAWLIGLVLVATLGLMFFFNGLATSRIDYGFFLEQIDAENLQKVTVYDSYVQGTFKTPPEKPVTMDSQGKIKRPVTANGDAERYNKDFEVFIPGDTNTRAQLFEKLYALQAKSRKQTETPDVNDPNTVASQDVIPLEIQVIPGNALNSLLTLISFGVLIATIIVIVLFFRRSREGGMMGGGFLSSFTRSTAKRYEPSDQHITFDDVAGLEGVKADLQEIVEFLKAPEKFQKLGGRVPKGVLLNGPPGTGKTLLARAVAGEAGVSFFSVNGSEFIQMFVGVGASRVRDLFATAKEHSPAIVFIDEIDAVGRQRGAGLGGGHDEREQTLNQILGEMDGFSPNDSVIIMAATNRPDVLDPALLRPGRFDRHITVGRPTLKGREEIFKVHVRDVPLDKDVDLHRLAEATVGLTGADIRNVVNEAALWAARQDKARVSMADFDYARDKVLMGAKREEVMLPSEKEKTAYHEAGHTLAAWFLPGAQRVHKVTVIPRGMSLGSTQILPSEDRMNMSESEIRDQLVVLLAGRAAEKIIYDETSVGAENDLERATSLARRMISHWGMSHKLGPVSYKLSDSDPFLGREIHQQRQFSERTQETIDSEIGDTLRAADRRATDILHQRREELERLKDALIEREELDEKELTELIGPSIHSKETPAVDAISV